MCQISIPAYCHKTQSAALSLPLHFALMANKPSYIRLLNVAYYYYIALAAGWLLVTLIVGHQLNLTALVAGVGFGAQLYFKKPLTHLFMGIIILPVSIFGFLHFVAWGGKEGFDGFIYTMMTLSMLSLICSIILVFGYLKTKFAEV